MGKDSIKSSATVLDLMCVDPPYQRLGAGRMLLRWGAELADKLNAQVSNRDDGISTYPS